MAADERPIKKRAATTTIYTVAVRQRERRAAHAAMITSGRQHGARSARLHRKLIAPRSPRRNPVGDGEKLRDGGRLT